MCEELDKGNPPDFGLSGRTPLRLSLGHQDHRLGLRLIPVFPTGRNLGGRVPGVYLLDQFLPDSGLHSRTPRRARGQSIGRPKALDPSRAALARRMQSAGEPVATIAAALGVSRATVYRVLAEE